MVPAPLLAAARVWKMAKCDQPGKKRGARARCERPPAARLLLRVPRRVRSGWVRCRLQLGHDPGLARRTIGRGAGASGCVAGRAGSLRGELRSTSGDSPFRAQAPFASPYSTFHFFVENGADSRLLLYRPTPHRQIRRFHFLEMKG